ncbi:MAG: 30S ribosomal protein S18 [Candidatus Yanofskybacteria bacterium]|nr:30S ribosomal protein S18 [Candidatus Yanofskybacteria bacterium]
MQCIFCQDNIDSIDYKDTARLRKFVTSEFRIGSAQRNKLCKKHQRKIANSIKISRYMALMPYTRNQTVKR